MAEARGYDPNFSLGRPEVNRDRAVETYWRAIESRGEHPKNVDIEFHIGELLAYIIDPKNGQTDRPDDALEVFEGIVGHYPKSNTFTIRSAVLAGDLRMMKGETQAGQAHYRTAIAGLAEAYLWRKSQATDPEADDFDLFNPADRRLFTVATRQYMNTVGPQGSLERLKAYQTLAEEFAGTPFERIARKNEAVLTEKLAAAAKDRADAVARDLAMVAPDAAGLEPESLSSAPPESAGAAPTPVERDRPSASDAGATGAEQGDNSRSWLVTFSLLAVAAATAVLVVMRLRKTR